MLPTIVTKSIRTAFRISLFLCLVAILPGFVLSPLVNVLLPGLVIIPEILRFFRPTELLILGFEVFLISLVVSVMIWVMIGYIFGYIVYFISLGLGRYKNRKK